MACLWGERSWLQTPEFNKDEGLGPATPARETGESHSIVLPAAGWMTEITAVPLECHLPVRAKTAPTLVQPLSLSGATLVPVCQDSDRCIQVMYNGFLRES